jgi:hypothetical protein
MHRHWGEVEDACSWGGNLDGPAGRRYCCRTPGCHQTTTALHCSRGGRRTARRIGAAALIEKKWIKKMSELQFNARTPQGPFELIAQPQWAVA